MSTLKELFDQHDRAAEEIERRARDFNPLRDELFAACREVLPLLQSA